MNTEWIAEETLAARLNIPREKMRTMRPVTVQKKGAEIEWPLADATALATRLGLTLAEPEASERSDIEELTVCSSPGPTGWHFGNHHLIQARRKSGEVVVVRVMDSRKFLPRQGDGTPMVFPARKSDGGNWWVITGREPRWKGRW